MEKRGLPAVALVGTPFAPMAYARAASLDYPDARIVVFEHPINNVDDATIAERGHRIVAEVIEAFLR